VLNIVCCCYYYTSRTFCNLHHQRATFFISYFNAIAAYIRS